MALPRGEAVGSGPSTSHGRMSLSPDGYVTAMNFDVDPGFEDYLQQQLRAVVQEAVDTVTQAHCEHSLDGVEDRLRSELSRRGVEINDEIWLNEVGDMIRANEPVLFKAPGSSAPSGINHVGRPSITRSLLALLRNLGRRHTAQPPRAL
jgi:hypothetical protein